MRPLHLQSVGRIWDPEMICYADGTLNPDGTFIRRTRRKPWSRSGRIAESIGLKVRVMLNHRLHEPQPIDTWILRFNMATKGRAR